MSWLEPLFRLGVNPLELVVRGTAMYWFLFLLFRVVLRRDVGALAIADVLLLVLIADAAQNGMSGNYETVTDGFILVGTIALWNYLLDWAAYRVPALGRLLQPAPLPLVREGRLLRANMRREMVTLEELQAKLREHGVGHLDEVRLATMESDGTITVLQTQSQQQPQNRSRSSRPAG
jgi:uncharacterized membrane protein YcaP (DUF421 family)